MSDPTFCPRTFLHCRRVELRDLDGGPFAAEVARLPSGGAFGKAGRPFLGLALGGGTATPPRLALGISRRRCPTTSGRCWGASAAWTGRADRSRGVAGLLGPTEGPPEGPRSVWQERCACMSSQGQWYESQVISRCGYAAQFDLSQHVNMTHLWKMARVSESMKTSVPSKPTQHATPLGQCLSTNHAHPKDPEWQP